MALKVSWKGSEGTLTGEVQQYVFKPAGGTRTDEFAHTAAVILTDSDRPTLVVVPVSSLTVRGTT